QLLSNRKELDSFSIIEDQSDLSADEMKQIIFEIKAEMKNLVVLLLSNLNNKPFISLMISEDLVKSKNWNAGIIIRELAKEIKGGGGGQSFFATAGGSHVGGLKNVTLKAREIFK
ncbi:MAG: DHHA1 domain-containing protein, partial [Flavobacteriales bacterium]|nr:DHHA1 domain-containing protein [Flavobacteriales bacterium]